MSRQVHHVDGVSALDLKAHLLRKEYYCISEDALLIRMNETQWDLSAAVEEGEGEFVKLTPRERAIAVQLLTSGGAHKEIADKLSIAVGTVRKHVEMIHRKLGIHSLAELIALARMRGHRRSFT